MKQFFRIAFLFCLIQFPLSCGYLNCSSDEDPTEGEITEISAMFGIFEPNVVVEHTDPDTLPASDAALRVFVSDLNYNPIGQTHKGSFISSAYACEPDIPVTFVQEIAQIADQAVNLWRRLE